MPTPLEKPLNILVVDDDEVDRMALRRSLGATNFDISITEAADADTALAAVEHTAFDCIFLDYHLPGRSGLALVKQIRHRGVKVPLIVLTGQGDEQTAVKLMKAGASDYLPKRKLSSEAIARLVRSAIIVHQAELRIEQANCDLREKNRLLERQNRELDNHRRYIYKQNLQLQEVSRLKSEFLATMSHELRTPLNAIIGFSQILLNKTKGPLTSYQGDMLSRVLDNGRNLLELINDILAFSKIEAGRLELEPAPMNLSQLVNSTVEELRSLATQKALRLEVDIRLSNPTVVNDQIRLRQILVNLISNAIKFTEQGSVRVQVEDLSREDLPRENFFREGEQADKIVIRVIDTGCGISDADQMYIFDAFHQTDQKMTRQHPGTGLGLAITYSLVNIMHGEIEVISQLEQGSTFKVELPREVTPQDISQVGELVFLEPPEQIESTVESRAQLGE